MTNTDGNSRGRYRGLAGNLLLTLVSTALTLGALEGVARWARLNQAGGKEQRTRTLYTDYDPLLGWRKRPGAQAVYDRREYKVEVVMNSHGLRDRERPYAPAPGAFRVLTLGDSFTEAFMVPFEDTISQQLERGLSGPGCTAEVINGGTVGYSTDQEYLFYKEQGHRYSPQVVVLFFYYNDVLYNAAPASLGIPKPLLSFDGGTPRVVNHPVPERVIPPPAEPVTPIFAGSAALDWLGERLERSAPRAYNALARTGLWAPIRKVQISPELHVYMRNYSPAIREAWSMTARILKALAEEVRLDSTRRLLVAYIPSRMEVNDRDWELTKLRYGLAEDKWDRDRVLGRLQEIGQAERFPVLDLTPALRRADEGLLKSAYYDFDSHWNSTGQQAAAKEVEGYLRRQGWTPPCAP